VKTAQDYLAFLFSSRYCPSLLKNKRYFFT